MASSPTEIPEWNKTMNYLFGEKWGKWLSRAMALGLLVGIIAVPAVLVLANLKGIKESLSGLPYVFNNPFMNSIASLIFVVVFFAGMFAVITLIAALIGIPFRVIFDTPFRYQINDTFIALLSLLEKAKENHVDTEYSNLLFNDTREVYDKWKRTKTNVMMQWLFPKYFKKYEGVKWDLVKKE